MKKIAVGLVAVVGLTGLVSACQAPKTTSSTPSASGASTASHKGATTHAAAKTVVFKVWGNAPSGVDVTYGSDSDNLQGHGLPMTKTLAVKNGALYYDVTAQLQGGGDVHCSVTIGGKTKEGHAQGGYNICSAQLNGGLFGGWE
jgi:hypothetical protein